MTLKTTAVIFITALVILAALLFFRSGYHKKAYNLIKHRITSPFQNKSKKEEITPKTDLKIEKYLLDRFGQLEIPRSEVSIIHALEDSTIKICTAVPRGKPIEWIIWFICSDIEATGYRVDDCFCKEEPILCTIRMESTRKNYPKIKIEIRQAKHFFSTAAKMAVVISDFGSSANAASADYLSFPEPLTFSILSNTKMSGLTAQIAKEYRKEIVILFPMEPLSPKYRQYSKDALFIHYPAEKIRTILNSAIESIPYFAGFSNLCGNLVVNDSRVMEIILTELKKKEGYFLLNPILHHESVAASLLREMNVPFRTVEISLDSTASSDSSAVDSLCHAAMIALKTGSVVFQARATPFFLNILKQQLAFLNRNGIRLVYLSEIMPKREQGRIR